MTRVDFYLATHADRDLLACRLAETAFRHGHRVVLWVGREDLTSWDQRLWTFSDRSFLPHACGEAGDEPVLVCADPPATGDVLIPLTDEPPDPRPGFARILEAIGPSEEHKERSRARFRAYRQLGLDPAVHTLSW